MDRLAAAFTAIDAVNADDPHVIVIRGAERPKEQAHAEMMTDWVRRLDPDCSEAQLLAARAHHLRRWSIPRHAYPKGRAGYLKWRTVLKRQHAEDVAEILQRVGYDEETVRQVQQIIRKEGLGRDPDPAVQIHEDALCLVFLETQFDELAEQMGEDKTIDVLRKTARKMSQAGLAAVDELPLSPSARDLIGRALASA